jgi:hypothetical protein
MYVYWWHNKWLTDGAKTIGEMAGMLEEAAQELREMEGAGVVLQEWEGDRGVEDGHAELITEDVEVAKKFHFQEKVYDEYGDVIDYNPVE